ncbi:hypothetical protein LCGC14_2085420 [marine sediment metagenome]|uniref:Citrate transporter-like domain-containing protein n=1 Tax=marine sediment metagenome TaxID=412755 RepID=A0A0F9F1N2_9ZZZZ
MYSWLEAIVITILLALCVAVIGFFLYKYPVYTPAILAILLFLTVVILVHEIVT